jgi:hypothetical protein
MAMSDDQPWQLDKIKFELWGTTNKAVLSDGNVVVIKKASGRYAIKGLSGWWPDLDPLAAQAVLYHLQNNAKDPGVQPNSACPICASQAQEIEPGAFDGYTIRCLGRHGVFGITDTAMTTRIGASQDEWEGALKRARARTTGRPIIRDDDF